MDMIVYWGELILLKTLTMDFGARWEFYRVTVWVKIAPGRILNINREANL